MAYCEDLIVNDFDELVMVFEDNELNTCKSEHYQPDLYYYWMDPLEEDYQI